MSEKPIKRYSDKIIQLIYATTKKEETFLIIHTLFVDA